MSVIDSERGTLVVRIVYDGPPRSGKTTTVRALSQRLSTGEVLSPEEAEGRTLYFDWVEYVGGLFEGRQIRCQIVSVPGQPELRHRRQFLLDSADAVVFVADTREPEMAEAHAMLEGLVKRSRLREPPIGIVFQANKRDSADALPRDVLRAQLDELCPMVLVESVATDAEGVREAFVLAVRLALDRTRALLADGSLEAQVRPEGSPAELLSRLHRLEGLETGGRESSPPQATFENLGELERLLPTSAVPVTPWTPGEETLFNPDPSMPSGHIWPPVDGRMLLHEVSRFGLLPVRTSRGDWWASGSGWRFHSASRAMHEEPYEARRLLVEWARLHASHAEMLSPRRALILADAGSRGHRLWQLVHVEAALRERLASASRAPDELVEELWKMGEHLLSARALFSTCPLKLRCTLWTVNAEVNDRPRFVGLMPGPGDPSWSELDGEALLSREFGLQLRELERQHPEYDQVRRRLRSPRRRTLVTDTLAELA